jgi:hypothetical protein
MAIHFTSHIAHHTIMKCIISAPTLPAGMGVVVRAVKLIGVLFFVANGWIGIDSILFCMS